MSDAIDFFGSLFVCYDGDMKDAKEVIITYTNWRGETADRRIIPIEIWFGSTEWHSTAQWLLKAMDIEKDAERDFALKDIYSWSDVPGSKLINNKVN